MTMISAGFVVTVCAVALSLATADEWCLWATIPVNLGLSILLFGFGRTSSGATRSPK